MIDEREQARRAKISAGQERRHRARREAQTVSPTHKRCTRCAVWKPLEEFGRQKRTLKSGEVVHYPSGACKECSRARLREFRANTPPDSESAQKRREATRRYRTSEKGRRYNREWWRMRHGKGIKIWSKYKHELHEKEIVLDGSVLLAWWKGQPEDVKVYVRRDEFFARVLRRLERGEQSSVEWTTVDKLGVYLDDVDFLTRLYGEVV